MRSDFDHYNLKIRSFVLSFDIYILNFLTFIYLFISLDKYKTTDTEDLSKLIKFGDQMQKKI